MPASEAPLKALGSSTTSAYGGNFGYSAEADYLEHVPAVVWPTSVATYNRMRTDPVCASILAAYTGPLLAADWRINPAGADPAMVAVCADSLGLQVAGEQAADIGAARRRGVKWVEFVRLASLHLLWGHMGFEPVYEIRDGNAYLRALPERMPSTIVEIKVNDDGTLKSIVQEGGAARATTPGGVEIPADRLLWFCHNREGANHVGRSILRSCYTDWTLKIDGKRANAVGINRFGAGTPVAEPLPGFNPTPAQIAEAQAMVSAIRVGETGGAVPVGFRLRIIGVEGALPDVVPTIRLYNEEMARGALTSILDLGSTANGSRALGDNFADMLKGAIQGVGDYMAEVATQLCERLTTFNAGEGAISPQVTCGDVGASKAAISTAIVGLVSAGLITPDPSLESFVREGYHLPAKATPEPAPPAPAPVEELPADQEAVTLAASGWQPWVHAAEGGADRNRGNAEALRRWFVHGEGAALIGWGGPNDHAKCVALASKHMTVEQAHGYCQLREKEATGLYTSQHAKQVRGAAEPPSPYREPTEAEQAAGIDPEELDAQQDGLVAEGATLMAAVVAVWGAALTAQITAGLAAGSLAALARLRVDSTDAAQGLAVLMREGAEAGVGQVLAEARRAGIPTPAELPRVDEAALDDAAEAAAELMGQGFARAAGKEAARLAAPGVDPGEVARQAVATVTESDSPIHDALHAEVSRAIGAGRTAAQQAVQLRTGLKLVPFHSALRDKATCANCADHDQHEYPDLAAAVADFPTGHYAACEGRSRCRCLIGMRPVHL